NAVALGLSHEGGRCFDPQAFDFVLEIAGHVVGAMIVTQLQSMRHPGRDGSEAPMHPLTHRTGSRASKRWPTAMHECRRLPNWSVPRRRSEVLRAAGHTRRGTKLFIG